MTNKTKIHSSAIIEAGAEIDSGVEIGAYAYIGSKVRIGKGTTIMHHATVEGDTTLGQDNEIHPYAFIGGKTHDLKYSGGLHSLSIGNENIFREYTTVHCATSEGLLTKVGHRNVILAYSHIAHECNIGNNLVMSSHSALGGHVVVHDNVNIGWGVGVHQFCRLGDFCMAAATSTILQDIPPFFTASGNPAKVRGINKVGLQRAGLPEDLISLIKKAYKIIYKSGLNRSQAIQEILSDTTLNLIEINKLVEFITDSKRGTS